jgi:UDP-glucuronate 4-epimerase
MGDVVVTFADISKAKKELGYSPKIQIEEGVSSLCKWFLSNSEFIKTLKF